MKRQDNFQVAQHYPQPKYGLPAVPASFAQRKQVKFAHVWYGLGVLLIACLLIGLAAQGYRFLTSLTASSAAPAKPISPPISGSPHFWPLPELSCPLQQTSASPGAKPSLDFCSPTYLGQAGGPAGARLILLGTNFPEQGIPDHWWLTPQNVSPQICQQAKAAESCIALPAPRIKAALNNATLYSWPWDSPFPTQKGAYMITAQLGTQLISSGEPFTLLTTQVPCITIAAQSAQKNASCAQPQNYLIPGNKPLTLTGSNWLLNWQGVSASLPLNFQLEVLATCAKGAQKICGYQDLFHLTIEPNRDGSFSKTINFPAGKKGTYSVTVRNRTDPTGLNGVQPTIADQALTFGLSEEMLTLTIQQ
ncbi:hypothetical protein EPA93_34430 [Ktedonosporobacter rubrisoli]|uniref:Uncharacterized protein n=1 Tax=Ktedonosporobacter rubrisoli TaxID=2509675 RepID=A0A4P6JZ73_KTERU|nr:hypothetical protein [Ktedonosporobacter rubrisoli]QBD80793.1 hypothetical protein EPA93_34430 [Ktedonosporobacter rubrisoli]